MNQSLEVLENQYFFLRGSLSVLAAHGATPEELDLLRTQIVRSRTNYWTTINKILHDDDPEVQDLISQLNKEQLTLTADLDRLEDIVVTLDLITRVVNLGSRIASKAISL